jgi:murein DD-endopeptidase MepM/ murein hydrolase activator NlpD
MRSTNPLVRPRLLPLLALAIALVVVPALAGAQSGDPRRDELQAAINELSAEQAAAYTNLLEIQSRRAAIEARVAELDAQRTAAQARLVPLEVEAARLTAQFDGLQAQVTATEAELEIAKNSFNASAAQMYRSARRGDSYGTVLAAKPTELVQQSMYLDHVASDRKDIVVRVRDLRNDLADQRAAVVDLKTKADAAAAEVRGLRDQLAGLLAELEPARLEAAAQAGAEQAALADIQSQKGQYEAELQALQATSDSISARIRAAGSGPGSPGPCGARPVPGAIGSGYGMRYHPILGYQRMHTGADMHASSGTPIRACRAGRVLIAGSQGGYGNAVVIDHGGWMATLYAHQSSIAVSEGQQVNAGDIIGYVGSTGMSTGPHLHFEVRLSGNPVDPAPYL